MTRSGTINITLPRPTFRDYLIQTMVLRRMATLVALTQPTEKIIRYDKLLLKYTFRLLRMQFPVKSYPLSRFNSTPRSLPSILHDYRDPPHHRGFPLPRKPKSGTSNPPSSLKSPKSPLRTPLLTIDTTADHYPIAHHNPQKAKYWFHFPTSPLGSRPPQGSVAYQMRKRLRQPRP